MAGIAKSSNNPTFESALAELEKIVAGMEGGQMTLEDSLAAYKRGAELLKFCQDALQDAQQQVKVLEEGVLRNFASPRTVNSTDDFQSWAAEGQRRIETCLEKLLPSADIAPQRLHAAMRYAVLEGGKRVRPLLAFAAGELSGADPAKVALAGAAVEIIHAYLLVHDDLPCMDDDVLRRGKPTCHVEFGEATALLVGDALQSLAFQVLSTAGITADPAVQLEMVKVLASAAGSRGMAGGQAIDLDAVGKSLSVPELEFMHIHKTGAIIRAATILGARCGRALTPDELDRIDSFAKSIGLAFQVVDDVLDAETPTATLGKTAGKDAEQNKPTYVSAMGVTRARAFAEELRVAALGFFAPFGDRATRLSQLADFIVLRKF